MQSLFKIFEQSFWQVLGKVVTTFSTFVILGIVARNYGKEGIGVFTLALTYLGIFYLLSDFGFNAHVLKNLKSQSSNLKTEWQQLLGTRILWSVVLVILAVGLLPFWPFATFVFSQAVFFGSLAIIGSGIFTTCNLIFQSKLRYDLSVLAVSVGTLLSLLVFIAVSFYKYPVPILLFVHLLGWVLIAFFALLLARKLSPNIFPVFDLNYMVTLLKDTWPIAATLALNVVYFRADSFMIA
ncbi:oligosaccharide flippase family protein, partial [Candidatus Daviesbacteria bacterium]|nr:oligosaccharide flippase family protein [Candidatus Daviesbacteria bacterium]